MIPLLNRKTHLYRFYENESDKSFILETNNFSVKIYKIEDKENIGEFRIYFDILSKTRFVSRKHIKKYIQKFLRRVIENALELYKRQNTFGV